MRSSSVRYGSLGRVDDRRREHGVLERGLDHGALGDRLGAHQPRAAARRGAERGEEHEPLHAGALGGPDQPPGGDAGELLDRAGGLVADHRGQVHDRVDAAQRVAERQVVGEVAEGDLHAHPLGAEPPRVAHQAADRRPGVAISRLSSGRPTVPGGAGQEQHRREATEARRQRGGSVECAGSAGWLWRGGRGRPP